METGRPIGRRVDAAGDGRAPDAVAFSSACRSAGILARTQPVNLLAHESFSAMAHAGKRRSKRIFRYLSFFGEYDWLWAQRTLAGMSDGGNCGHGFFTTPWSLVIAAGSLDEEAGRKALGELVRLYKPALTCYLRKKFCADNEDLAEELFSAFVEKILVGKELVGKAHPRQGHQFRQFILRALHRFAITELRRLQTLKRQPPQGIESLDRLLEYDGAELASISPTDFDVAWARNVVAEALRRMEEDCVKSGRPGVWGVFEHRLRAPILDGVPPMPYGQLVKRYGFESPGQAYNALGAAKRKFEQHLREVISNYVADWNSVDAELRELQVILAHATSANQ